MIKYLFLIILIISACSRNKNTDIENKQPLIENTSQLQDATQAPFYHGVASGDPYENSVVLWTRITPTFIEDNIDVTWEIATDEAFKEIVDKGSINTGPEKDYTVKPIADGLKPNSTYYYRFKYEDKYSQIGTTKTLGTGDDNVNLAFVSCSNIEFGYFNAYAAICKEDIDAVVHLGDYIYEYGPNRYGDSSFHKKNIPPHEIVTLQDYRDRYSQYRLDPDLRNIHGKFPFINIWDDHEITNNAYKTGAENHQKEEGDYNERKEIAKQVYYEWLPIREGASHYRKFSFGNSMDLFMLDERLAGRTMQVDSITDPRRTAPDHSLLGQEQLEWLNSSLSSSNANWKIIGNQVIFSYCDWGYESFRFNMDAWDGYPNDQEALYNTIKENDIKNVVFVTGDTHSAWAFDATNNPFENYNRKTGDGAIGVEFGVTSVTSANANERFATEVVLEHEKKIVDSEINPHLKYANLRDHGYLLLNINQDKLRATYKIVPSIKESSPDTKIDKVFEVESGTPKLLIPEEM